MHLHMAMAANPNFPEFDIEESIELWREVCQIKLFGLLRIHRVYSSAFHTNAPGCGNPICARTRLTNCWAISVESTG